MRLRTSYWACCWICVVVALVRAQGPADPLTGIWRGDWGPTPTHRNAVVLELKWNGKTVTGTINPGSNAVKLKNTRFDLKTGTLHLEADFERPKQWMNLGKVVVYLMDGTVQDGTLIGDWHHQSMKGDFKLLKK